MLGLMPGASKSSACNGCIGRHRSKNRRKHPKTQDFELLHEHIPTDFHHCADVQHSGMRHLVLANDEQLKLLSKAKMWYVDATFKVVKQSFT